jgi:hypothetical protein
MISIYNFLSTEYNVLGTCKKIASSRKLKSSECLQQVILPHEDDSRFSIYISKELLLADDDKSKKPFPAH